MSVTIEPLSVPETVNTEVEEYARVVNASYSHSAGTGILTWEAKNLLAQLQNQTYSTSRAYLARDGGRIVGATSLQFDNSTAREAEIMVAVDPAHPDPSLADSLYGRIEREAAALGRGLLIDYVPTSADASRLAESDVIRPPSGVAGVPRGDARSRILMARGYELGLVERASVFERPADASELRRILDAASADAGSDYEPIWWSRRTPEEHVDAYAYAVSRMSTDVPSGDIDVDEQTWDAERIRARDERHASVGHLFCVAAVVHRPSAQIVAFNELIVASDRAKPTENGGTLVLSEHRGHRLGTIVKALGLLRWLEAAPESPAVFTFNAEENRYMLDVNERVGFRPVFWEGAWSRQL